MPEKFDTSLPPFDRLTASQQTQLRHALDVAYYREGDIIVRAGDACHSLFIIIKGVVEEQDAANQELYSHYTQDDIFDVRAQFESQSKHHYVALEDTLCYLLSNDTFLSLYHANKAFAGYFDTNLANRNQLLETAHQQQNLAEFILTRIDDAHIQPCIVLDAQTSLYDATLTMQERNIDCAFIEMPTEATDTIGIITRTDLLHATLLDKQAPESAVHGIATAPVISVNKGDYLFNATIAMTRQKVKRVLVLDQGCIAGMLDLTQVLSLFSTHSHVLTLRIARAEDIESLAQAAHSQPKLIETLLNNGIHTRFVMELIAAVNEQIIEKAFQLVVPLEMQSRCCLIVMGSEGRGEQILKTDQDNALILADDLDWPDCADVMARFSETLLQLGYPPCPGSVMVNNPHWVKTQTQWQNHILQHKRKGTEESLMSLAMLADAHPIAGQKGLFQPIAQCLHDAMHEQQLLLATFVRPAMQFNVPLTLFGKLKKSKAGLDIKKGGIFPIVHGVRTIALEAGIEVNNTFARLNALEKQRFLEPETVANLSEALKLFIKLRLREQLTHPETGTSIHTEALNRTERDLLRHSLHVVKKFQQWLGFHYQLRE
ncbi:DUF294 nucleotidyltransferase-like domain-containing protein [Thaumasiovibrio subtropicus]|uniref:DUF294 nucleotidyltransferase-like domain-containing protein n=1 Tax=Thaumasiovibrio subtropicus TaxID=1891207 RepID=UPI000B360801|nr:DUF294 nucleotidyltransferase-like domain-containing protein [Thaumasiovibrio subtropicus]